MRKILTYNILFALILSTIIVRAQLVTRIVTSRQADSNVMHDNDTNIAMLNDSVTRLNKLYVFLPGSGATPLGYADILETAANLGYHSLGLGYNNDSTVASLCSGFGPWCEGAVRAEIFYGKNYSAQVNVDTSESIRTRLVAMLKYLQAHHPLDNWGQYLDANDSVIWSQVCISGHSQGAATASLIAYWYPVWRGVFFATGGDANDSSRSVSLWMQGHSVTPPGKKYAFDHRYDELYWGTLPTTPVIWDTLGIGNYLDFDTLSGNYYHAHSFTSYDTVAIPPSPIRYHNCVVTDHFTPIISGNFLYLPLWIYMLTDTSTVTGIQTVIADKISVLVYPNPSGGVFKFQVETDRPDEPFGREKGKGESGEIEIYNVLGEKVYSQFNIQTPSFNIDLSAEPNGIYFYRVLDSSGALEVDGKIEIER